VCVMCVGIFLCSPTCFYCLQARGLAGASQRMRELVKSSAGSLNDLDQLGKRAQLENHVLFRSQRFVSRYNSLNASCVTLG